MTKQCPKCGCKNQPGSSTCLRCLHRLGERENISSKPGLLKSTLLQRAAVCLAVLVAVILGFYTSLVFSADKLTASQTAEVNAAIRILEQKGFVGEVYFLKYLAAYRANDNWLNASVAKESAYAATNFPFEIVTLYPDFFTYPIDETEQAAILLHEAKHLQGMDEKEAYEFVWKNRNLLGWTSDEYAESVIWRETRKLTKEHVPNLFVCDFEDYSDCTEVASNVKP